MTQPTPVRASRQTRRWRERQQTRTPAASPRQPFVLLCCSEDDQGSGAWIMVEVDDPAEGDAFARELQAAPPDVLGELQLPRCELVANTPEGLQAWAAANIKRRDAARRLGEVLR